MHKERGISPFVLCSVLFVAGAILGIIGLRVLSPDEKAELASYLEIFVRNVTAGGLDPAIVFKLSLAQNLKTALLTWALGLAVIGTPFACLIVAIRGFALGFSSTFLIKEVSGGGTYLFISGILPHSLISVPVLVMLCSLAVSFSVTLLREKPWAHGSLWSKVGSYTLRFFLVSLLFVLSSAVEAYVCPFFLARFSGG